MFGKTETINEMSLRKPYADFLRQVETLPLPVLLYARAQDTEKSCLHLDWHVKAHAQKLPVFGFGVF